MRSPENIFLKSCQIITQLEKIWKSTEDEEREEIEGNGRLVLQQWI
jgi:hypothetical protein